MKFSLKHFLFMLAVVACFSWSVHWLSTKGYDRGFAWTLAIGSALAGAMGVALVAYDIDSRLNDIEAKLERLDKKSNDRDPPA